jgi:shikimate kinase
MKQPLVLVGPMGVGKTTVGKKLAKELNTSFVDTDKLISAEHGSISSVFERLGEPGFRKIESEVLARCLEGVGVVATGGGVVTTESNRKLLKSHNVIYLSTNGQNIASRISPRNRPLLSDGSDSWSSIYESRKPLYLQVATHEVDTSGKSLSNIVSEISALVTKK